MQKLSILKKYFNGLKKNTFFYVIMCLLNAFVILLIPIITGDFIDFITNHPNLQGLYNYCMKFFVIEITSCILIMIVNYMNLILITRLTYEFNIDIIRCLLNCSLTFIKDNNAIYLSHRIYNDCNTIMKFLINVIQNTIIYSIYIIFPIIFIFKISKVISIILLICIILYSIFYFFIKNKVFSVKLMTMETENILFSKLSDIIINLKSIIINSLDNQSLYHVYQSFRVHLKNIIRFSKISIVFTGLDKIINSISQVCLFFIGGVLILNKRISLGDLTICISFFSYVTSGLSYFFNFGKTFQEVKVSVNRINEIVNAQYTLCYRLINDIHGIDCIHLKNFSFKYRKNIILNNLNCRFEKGNLYIINGNNGTGKTTLIDLILGIYFYEYEGDIYINKYNIKNINMKDIRNSYFSVCCQNLFLIEEDLKNLKKSYVEKLNDLKLNEKKILETAYTLIEALDLSKPLRFYSDGEKKKIYLFNTFLKISADVFIFDEPESALDVNSRLILKDLIYTLRKDKIIIVVTHNDFLDNAVTWIKHINLD